MRYLFRRKQRLEEDEASALHVPVQVKNTFGAGKRPDIWRWPLGPAVRTGDLFCI